MRLIIAGCRDFNPDDHRMAKEVESIERALGKATEIVHGGAKGVDSAAARWAGLVGRPSRCFMADWNTYGKAAGPLRNREMAKYGDALLAFWDGRSPGTRNMIDEAAWAKKPVFIVPL